MDTYPQICLALSINKF